MTLGPRHEKGRPLGGGIREEGTAESGDETLG